VSFGSIALQAIFKLLNIKKIVYRGFKNPPRNTGVMDADKFDSSLSPRTWTVDGFKLISINEGSSSGRHVMFFHGGAYIMEASALHRKLMEALAREGLTVTFVDYPKAPEHTFRTTHDVALKAYLELVRSNPGNDFCLVGDSAGGGLALAFLQVLRDKGVQPFPTKTVLISPWVDLAMGNERIAEYEPRDLILPVEGLIYAAERYSGGEELSNPLLSPLNGDMSNLGKIMLLFGTNEVFLPDCLELAEKLRKSPGSSVGCIIGEKMIHDWVIAPLRESRRALEQIARFLLAD